MRQEEIVPKNRKGPKGGFFYSQKLVGYWFILPSLAFFLLFVIVPLFVTIYLSFTKYNILMPAQWIGLSNFANLFTESSLFLKALMNTCWYVAGVIPPTVVIALLLALLVNKAFKFITVFRAIYYIPVITSMVAVSVIWVWIFSPETGVANQILEKFGLPPSDWLRDPSLAMACIVLVAVWKGIGYYMLIYLAGLQGIPTYLYEVAKIDGASRWNMFWWITLPLLRPTTFFVFVVLCIQSFQVFDQVYVMTRGGPTNATTVVVYRIFTNGFIFLKMGYASSMASLLFAIILIFTYFNVRLLRGEIEYW